MKQPSGRFKKINLKNRTLLFFLIQGLILITLIFFIGRILTVQQLNTLAKESAKKSSLDIVSDLNAELESLKSTTLDYSTDDELHSLMDINSAEPPSETQIENLQTYVNGKLHIATNITLKLSSIYILTNDGQIIYENENDYLQRRDSPSLHASSLEKMKTYISKPNFYQSIQTRDVLNGVTFFNDELTFISAQPILTSKLDGPKHGILIMTRILNHEKFNTMYPEASFSLIKNTPKTKQSVESQFTNFENVSIKTDFINEEQHLYETNTYISDILNQDTILIKDYPVDLYYQNGVQSINVLFMMIIIFSFLLIASTWFYMNRYIVSRIARILRDLTDVIGEDEFFFSPKQNEDELTIMERNIDKLLKQLKLYHSKLVKRSYIDPLTGLHNRLGFHEESKNIIDKSMSENTNFIILFLDIDRFKHINDTYSHKVGDLLISEFAHRLMSIVPTNSIVARISGDEFTVLITQFEEENQLLPLLEDIHNTLNIPYSIQGHKINTSASIGVSQYPKDGKTIEDLINHADLAMYSVKKTTRNTFSFFDSSMKNRITAKSIESGIEKNEFYLVYQPQFNMDTNSMIGLETLLRWNHPIYGNVPPSEFITIAEENNLIIQLTEWVMEQTMIQINKWRSEYDFSLKVSINISTLHLYHKERLYHSIINQLEQYNIPPSLLNLEITESFSAGLNEDLTNQIVETLQKLTDLGIDISIDDFGKKYSVLNYLQHLPITGLKIDRSFINEIESNDKIVRMIIALADALELNVIAEGIETSSQKIQLQQMGCKIAQGYLYSKPLLPKQLEETYFIK